MGPKKIRQASPEPYPKQDRVDGKIALREAPHHKQTADLFLDRTGITVTKKPWGKVETLPVAHNVASERWYPQTSNREEESIEEKSKRLWIYYVRSYPFPNGQSRRLPESIALLTNVSEQPHFPDPWSPDPGDRERPMCSWINTSLAPRKSTNRAERVISYRSMDNGTGMSDVTGQAVFYEF